MTQTSKWIKVFSLLLILSYLVACSGSTPAPKSTPIKIGWTLWQGDFTLLVAYQMGFFSLIYMAPNPKGCSIWLEPSWMAVFSR
jgi:hypothetical protein